MTKDEIEVYSDYDGEDITILVRVDYYKEVKPNSNADNPDDYYGYTDVDYTVMKITKVDCETNEEVELDESILTSEHHDQIDQKIRDSHDE